MTDKAAMASVGGDWAGTPRTASIPTHSPTRLVAGPRFSPGRAWHSIAAVAQSPATLAVADPSPSQSVIVQSLNIGPTVSPGGITDSFAHVTDPLACHEPA